MKATTKIAFLHDQLGKVEAGDFEVNAEQAASLRHLDFITLHEKAEKKAEKHEKPAKSSK